MADNNFMPSYPSLNKHNIPYKFEYTDKLVSLLMRIAETKPYLENYLGKPLEVQLLRQAKILAVTYSNQIEGNKLEVRGVTEVLEGHSAEVKDKDILEIRNYIDALEYVEVLSTEGSKLKVGDMLDIQKLITKDLISDKKQWGAVRSTNVIIADANTGNKIDDVPEAHFVEELLSDLWKWLDDNESINPFVKAFAFHFMAVSIHPFVDGNGRTMRLMQHLLLLKSGEKIARFVPSETVIMETRTKYYSAIRQCKSLQSLNPILEYLAECFASSAERVIVEAKLLVKKSIDRKPEARRAKIITLSKQKKEFTIQDVLQFLPEIPRRTLERDLETLVKKKHIKAKGDRKARIYSKA